MRTICYRHYGMNPDKPCTCPSRRLIPDEIHAEVDSNYPCVDLLERSQYSIKGIIRTATNTTQFALFDASKEVGNQLLSVHSSFADAYAALEEKLHHG